MHFQTILRLKQRNFEVRHSRRADSDKLTHNNCWQKTRFRSSEIITIMYPSASIFPRLSLTFCCEISWVRVNVSLVYFCFILFYSVFFCFFLFFSVFFCFFLFFSVFFCFFLFFSVLFCFILFYSVLFCFILLRDFLS